MDECVARRPLLFHGANAPAHPPIATVDHEVIYCQLARSFRPTRAVLQLHSYTNIGCAAGPVSTAKYNEYTVGCYYVRCVLFERLYASCWPPSCVYVYVTYLSPWYHSMVVGHDSYWISGPQSTPCKRGVCTVWQCGTRPASDYEANHNRLCLCDICPTLLGDDRPAIEVAGTQMLGQRAGCQVTPGKAFCPGTRECNCQRGLVTFSINMRRMLQTPLTQTHSLI